MSFDGGLQPERTALAWRRTGLAGAVGALALARIAVVRGSVAIAVSCAVIVAIGVATLPQGTREIAARTSRDGTRPPAPTLPAAARGTVLVVTLLAGAGLVLVAVS